MQRISPIIVFILVCPALPVYSQDVSPKNFYKRDFAGSTFDSVQNPSKRRDKTKPSVKETIDQLAEEKEDSKFQELTGPEVQSAAAEEDLSYEEAEGIKALSISLIVNSDDREHYFKALKELLEVSKLRKIDTGAVMALGNHQQKLFQDIKYRELHIEVLKQKGRFSYPKEMPDQYKTVKLSPTWVVQTEKGRIILEAPGRLRKFFNKKGEVVRVEGI